MIRVLALLMIFVVICIQICSTCNAHVDSSRTRTTTKKRGMEGFVLGGVQADIEMFPWLAQVLRLGMSHCGGVVISRRVILSAAHCVVDEDRLVLDPEDFEVILGSSLEGMGSDWYNVSKIIPHPSYLSKDLPVYYFDICVMLLSAKIQLSERVQIAKIAPHKKWKNKKLDLVVAGYGVISNEMEPAGSLYMTTMHFVDRQTCKRLPTDFGRLPIPLHIFCMLGKRPTSDCVGDSGSAVMWESYVVGIVSHGRGNLCGSQTIPSMYVDLSFFKGWIMVTVRKLENKCNEEE